MPARGQTSRRLRPGGVGTRSGNGSSTGRGLSREIDERESASALVAGWPRRQRLRVNFVAAEPWLT